MRTVERAIFVLVIRYKGSFETKMKYRESLEKLEPCVVKTMAEALEELNAKDY